MSYRKDNEDESLAYGDDYGQSRGSTQGKSGGDRGFLGDALRTLKSKYDQHQASSQQDYGYTSAGSQQPYYGTSDHTTGHPPIGQPAYQGGPPTQAPQKRPDLGTQVLSGLHSAIHSIGSDVAGRFGPGQQSQQQGYQSSGKPPVTSSSQYQGTDKNRFDSFAPEKSGNDVKWYVDGCGYFWAVSKALEDAKESIWILDWWLSPELYLRRPPAKNEDWRLDRVLQRAAQRGVKVNIIVYKEVTQALTLSSAHTKHALEALSPNIAVFRHPDHLPDAQTGVSSLTSSLQGLKLDAAGASKLGADTLKGIYGISDDVILYWAHHEKLCMIDQKVAFMGGLDLCFGRWDTNQHSIADAHPSDLTKIAVPGQDYNNARVMDFSDVANPFQNKLDRTKSSRMGWSDISICLQGSCITDLSHHFTDRWNFIYDEKYNVRKDVRYSRISHSYTHSPSFPAPKLSQSQGQSMGNQFPPPPGSQPYVVPAWKSTNKPSYTNPVTTQSVQTQQLSGYNEAQAPYTITPHTENFPPPPSGAPPPQSQWETSTPQDHGRYQISGGQSEPYYPPPPPRQQDEPQHAYVPYHQPVSELSSQPSPAQTYQHQYYQPPPGSQDRGFGEPDIPAQESRGLDSGRAQSTEGGIRSKFDYYKTQASRVGQELTSYGNMATNALGNKVQQFEGTPPGGANQYGQALRGATGSMSCQILRSATRWSNGTPTEHSIQNAYIDVIQKSQHFVYIENQFFITATGDKQKPVKNLIGKALVERIIRAARNNERYKVIVLIPSVPAFAGDLKDESSLGTRAIMEFQYNSINRGDNSIMQLIAKAGINPMDYIRFYNLRNYDRINASDVLNRAEKQSGVSYESARREHDDMVGAGYGIYGEQTGVPAGVQGSQYQQYQSAAKATTNPGNGRWDTVAECYMLGGQDIRSVPWDGSPESELQAFVSEELYIHSKVMIADDRVVICGSANLNDRSQLGYHDSEIAILISDSTPVQSYMAGQPWTASRFAASLRRQLFRKHLGLLRPQNMQQPDANFETVAVPNDYDWGTPEDNIVADPLSDAFLSLWNSRARTNTTVFRKAFRAVPDDNVYSWSDYKEFYEYYFRNADSGAEGKKPAKVKPPPRVEYGHVVREDFPGGVRELKELLSQVRGTLVEMPLTFLQNEDIAKEGLTLNALTEELYT